MAQLDPTLREPTLTDDMAYRADAFRLGVRLVREAEVLADATPEDLLELARFLANG